MSYRRETGQYFHCDCRALLFILHGIPIGSPISRQLFVGALDPWTEQHLTSSSLPEAETVSADAFLLLGRQCP